MANKKIVQQGIITPQIDLGDQSQSGSISYDAGSNTITITANLHVDGVQTEIATDNVVVSDNIMILNDGEPGAGVGGGTGLSGFEIDRGSITNVRFVFDETDDTFKAILLNGNGINFSTDATPTNNDHLTNKNYVDSQIDLNNYLNELNDVDISDIPNGTPPGYVFASGGWDGYSIAYNASTEEWEPRLIPPGIASLELTSPQGTLEFTPTGPQFGGTLYTIDLVDQSPDPTGSYTSSDITVNSKGVITSISSGNVWKTFLCDNVLQSATADTASDSIKISGGTGLTTSIPNSNTLVVDLDNSGVVAGTYTSANITVDAKGRVTFASNGGGGGGTNLWLTIAADSGSVSANTPTDTLTIAGGTGIFTARSGDAIIASLENTGVSAGTYTNANITVDSQGRIVTASSGSSGGGGGISSLIEDPSPDLGGNLNVNGYSIVSAGNGDIKLDPGGTGRVDVSNAILENLANPTSGQHAATKSYVDSLVAASGGVSGSSLGATGWVRFSNGFTIQWTGSFSAGSPKAWSRTFTSVFSATVSQVSGSSQGETTIRISSLSTSSITVQQDSGGSGTGFRAIAVGLS